MRILFSLFIVIPILEMVLLIKVGSIIGAIPTVGLVLLTAVIGITLLRQQGFETLNRLQARLAQGEIPGTELVEGAMLLVGGALLLTPGFFTDAVGFVCLLPLFRRPIASAIIRQGILTNIHTFSGTGSFNSGTAFRQADPFATRSEKPKDRFTSSSPPTGRHTIDGEFVDESDKKGDLLE
jgi:UPF0716 protein FxsA